MMTVVPSALDSTDSPKLLRSASGGDAECLFTPPSSCCPSHTAVNNLFDEEPPAMYTVVGRAGVGGPNTLLYDTIGRRLNLGVRLNF